MMCGTSHTVRVKWGKKKFEGVELNTDESPEVFKMQLFSLSGESSSQCKTLGLPCYHQIFIPFGLILFHQPKSVHVPIRLSFEMTLFDASIANSTSAIVRCVSEWI